MSKLNKNNNKKYKRKKYNNKKLHFIVFQTSEKPVNFSVSKWLVYSCSLLVLVFITVISIFLCRIHKRNVYLSENIANAKEQIEMLKVDKIKADIENNSLKSSLEEKNLEIEENIKGLEELQNSLKAIKELVGIEDELTTVSITSVTGSSRGISNLDFRNNGIEFDTVEESTENEQNTSIEQDIKRTQTEMEELQSKLENKIQYMKEVPSKFPTTGRYTSFYGARWGKFHRGIDISNNIGTDICAAGDGVVIESSYGYSYGYYVTIQHKYGFKTRYAHLCKRLVSVGDEVNQGDVIGLMGSTGVSTGSHLHYEIMYYGKYINPLTVEKYFE